MNGRMGRYWIPDLLYIRKNIIIEEILYEGNIRINKIEVAYEIFDLIYNSNGNQLHWI